MHCELIDQEWTAIKSMLPNKPPGVPRVNDRPRGNRILSILHPSDTATLLRQY